MRDLWTIVLAQQTPPDAPPNPPVEIPTNGSQPGATTTQPQGSPGNGGPPPANPFGGQFLWIMIVMIAVMMFFTMTSQRKEKKKREAILAALKKGDKIQTVGGILGTVVEVRDNDVVVKVDENNNSRVKFVRSAIQSVIEEKESA